MPMLDSLKDPNTGKIKTPILISLIGGGGLFAFLLFSGKGGNTAGQGTGQSSPLTPDLTGLQDALKGLAANPAGGGGGGASSGAAGASGGSGGGGVGSGGAGAGGASSTYYSDQVLIADGVTTTQPNQPILPGSGGAAPVREEGDPTIVKPGDMYIRRWWYTQPDKPLLPGSGGAAGGGGSGTGAVINPIAKTQTVYGGLAANAFATAATIQQTPEARSREPAPAALTFDQWVSNVAARSPDATRSAVIATALKNYTAAGGTVLKAVPVTSYGGKGTGIVNPVPAAALRPPTPQQVVSVINQGPR